MNTTLGNFTDVLTDEISNSQPMSLSPSAGSRTASLNSNNFINTVTIKRPPKGTGQRGQFRSIEEIDPKYRDVFSYPYFNLVQSNVIEDALYSDKSIVVCAPTGSGKTVVFEMAIVQLLMELEEKQCAEDFKIIYMAPVKALCTERLTEWYSKFTKLGLLCIEVTGDTDVDFTQLRPYKIIITTPEKWDMLTRRWRDHRGLVEIIKLFLIDEVHILNDEVRGPVLEAVVSRMKTIENSAQSVYRIEKLQKAMKGEAVSNKSAPRIRFVAMSATVSNPEDVADWLGTSDKPAVFYKFGDECRPVKLKRVVEGYPCPEGTSIFKFDIILNYKLWPVIQKYHSGKPTLIFCNTRKSVLMTAETLSRELTISFNAEQKAKLTAVASSIKNKKLQALVMNGVGCHHAGLLYEERQNIEMAFRNRDLPILITTTTLAMGVNLPAHLVIVKNTQQYVNGTYQEYSISTVLQMVGRAGRPQFDTEATAVIMTRLVDKPRYQALVYGCEPLQSFLHKRLAENLNSEAALGTVGDVAQCVQWLRSTFLYVRAARDPKKYLGLPQNSPQHLISKKIEELCVKAMNGLASSGLITMDEASCIESTEAGRLMSIFYLDLETMKHIMKIEGNESLERLLALICESHELADMHLRVDERRCLNTLNRNNAAATIRFPMKGKISTRQMKLNCIIQAVLGCLTIPDPSLNQEAMKIMRIADRICKCLVTYITRPDLISHQPQFYSAVLNTIILAKCVAAHLWENSPFVSKQLKGIGPTFSTLLASAGKVNFMLLEESHPRDLERIMNKGAPAGNIIRKQVSLLPKYQLTMIPVDERTVTVQLLLANQCHLAENMEELTAGDNHKSYIIVGDSNNNILLLAAFKDKDLISVFDGTITHQVTRKSNFEHKIFAHCISSTFVGIDVHSEYLFNGLNEFFEGQAPNKKTTDRQTCITETYKERKRKNTDTIDKTQSKEKKKSNNAIIEHFKCLKESFKAASKNANQNKLQQSYKNDVLDVKVNECTFPNDTTNSKSGVINTQATLNSLANENKYIDDIDSDEFMDDEKINSILNQIENEMCKRNSNLLITKTPSNNSNLNFREEKLNSQNYVPPISKSDCINNIKSEHLLTKCSSIKTISRPRKRRLPVITKSNYNFMDSLERSLSDDDDKTDKPQKDTGFSDAIKNQIQKYIANTKTKTNVLDGNVEMLLNKAGNEQLYNDGNVNKIKSDNYSSYSHYEIKEFLDSTKLSKQNNNIHHAETKPAIQKYIANTNTKTNVLDENVEILLNKVGNEQLNNDGNVNKIKSDNYSSYPCYEIKEILDGTKLTKQNNKIQHAKTNPAENVMCDTNPINTKIMNEVLIDKLVPPLRNTETGIFVGENASTMTLSKFNENHPNEMESLIDIRGISHEICSYKQNHKTDGHECNKTEGVKLTKIREEDSCSRNNECHGANINSIELDINNIDSHEVRNKCFKINNTFPDVPSTDLNENRCNNILCSRSIPLDYKNIPNMHESNRNNNLAKMPHTEMIPYDERTIASYNDTLMEEDVERNFHIIKLLDGDTSNCDSSVTRYTSPSTKFMNDDQNQTFSNNYSKQINTYHQNAEYVKRYTYSTNKIDVSTKRTPEYCVQVIKKVKMDLDITAIVSRNHNSFQNNCEESENRNSETNNICLAIPKSENTCLNTNKNSIMFTNDGVDEIQSTSNVNLYAALKFPRPQLLPTNMRESKVNVLESNKASNPEIIYNTAELVAACDYGIPENLLRNNSDTVQSSDVLQDNHKDLEVQTYTICCDSRNINENLGKTDSEDNVVKKDYTIKNILKKYENILGKNIAQNGTPSTASINNNAPSDINFNERCNKSINLKSKSKPFKISDIDKLQAPLPNSIIDPKPEAENNSAQKLLQFLKINDSRATQNGHEIQNESQCMPMEAVSEYRNISDLDLEPIDLPTDVELDTSNDFKIDQSMFDPKTLLQCVVDDGSDEIVPPPPEFCDGFSYSPDYNTAHVAFENSIEHCSRDPQLVISIEKDSEYNASIFDDPCPTDLTPSREIETWNLSREDSSDYEPHNSVNTSPSKSYTVIRKNTKNIFFLQNSHCSRKTKLGKFRVTQKNKLRIKK